MSASDQERFLGRLRRALGHVPRCARKAPHLFAQQPSEEESKLLKRYQARTPVEQKALFDGLAEAARAIHLRVIPVPDFSAARAAIADLAREKAPEWGVEKHIIAWRHPLIDALHLTALLDPAGIQLHQTEIFNPGADPTLNQKQREHFRNSLGAAYIGITSADFCLAETGTLVLRNRPGQARSVALVPSIHIAVIGLDQILSDMKELFALLRWDDRFRTEGMSNYMAFISGPSKTADIEATMVRGAHGPREVHLFVVSPASSFVHSPGPFGS